MTAGRLQHRLRWESRQTFDDGYGNTQTDFAEEFTCWAEVKPSLGIETVNAARLQGQQPVDIVVRLNNRTREIAADWRAVDVNEDTIYAIKAPPIDMQQYRAYLTIKAVAGVAE